MSMDPERIKELDAQVRAIADCLGWEFDQEYAKSREGNWDYRAELNLGTRRISFHTSDYKIAGRFVIRGEFPKDKKGQFYISHNDKWPQITVAIAQNPEKIAKEIKSRLLPEYEKQLAVALERIEKNDAYHAGRLRALQEVAIYFGLSVPVDDDKAIYPSPGLGIYKVEATGDGIKFNVECTVTKALQIFDILK